MAAKKEFNAMFKKRATLLIAGAVVWAFIAANYLFYFSYFNRTKYIDSGFKMAMRKGYYSAGRGRILDKNGVPLAWSERFFDLLLLKAPELPKFQKMLDAKLRHIFPDIKSCSSTPSYTVIYYNIPPNKIAGLERTIHEFPDLKIIPRTERVVVDYPEIKKVIGKVKMSNSLLCGISGIELQFDETLTGKVGIYTVMLDRHKNFINGTWHLVKKAQAGEDIILSSSCTELKHAGRKP
jgi:cell division protein FtsI/penicillin-binding protein 2